MDTRHTPAQALRLAAPLPLAPALVEGCIDAMGEQPAHVRDAEAAFRRALSDGLAAVPPEERHGLAAAAGHIAESLVELVLADLGWQPYLDSDQPLSGGHGVDLLMLEPGFERLFAAEVKGTLQAHRWPRLSRRLPAQLSEPWLDKADNPGMRDSDLVGADVSGLVVAVQLPAYRFRAAASADLLGYRPVMTTDHLEDADWLFEAQA